MMDSLLNEILEEHEANLEYITLISDDSIRLLYESLIRDLIKIKEVSH